MCGGLDVAKKKAEICESVLSTGALQREVILLYVSYVTRQLVINFS